MGRFSPSVHANTWVPTGSAPVPGLTVSATELRSHQRPCGGAGQGARPCPTAAECRARRVPARAAGRAYITVTKFTGSGDKARGIGVGARFDADSAVEGDGFKPSVPVAREAVYFSEGELRGDRTGHQRNLRGTDGSNPSPSSGFARKWPILSQSIPF
jgi:hypothetical protein